jgi:signal transduction histidine kinase
VTDPTRRHRLAHLIITRRLARFERSAFYFRAAAVVVAALACLASSHHVWVVLIAPALIALALDATTAQRSRGAAAALTLLWVLAGLLLAALPAWVVTDLPFLVRCLGLGAADVVVVSVAGALFLHPGWFDPALPSRWPLEQLRRLAGPVSAVVTAAIIVPAPWPVGTMPAVWACALVPLFVGARIHGVDQTVRNAVPLIREEGQRGRDQVLREIHGTLSTELRQLEQYARDHRGTAPELYERAVSANSSLRETLTLTDEERDTSTTTDTLVAPVLTLTRAEGAAATVRVEVDHLADGDRDLVRLVLNELVGNALRAGAAALEVTVTGARTAPAGPTPDRGGLLVTVTAAQLPDPDTRLSWSTVLDEKLAARDGSLSSATGSDDGSVVVQARWRAEA